MTDEYDSDLARRTFAAERSHKDAANSNEMTRSTSQAAILINGGAATAVLAFLAKDKIDPWVLRIAPFCLAGYVIGVVSGALMMYCTVRSLDFYSMRWRLAAHPEEGMDAKRDKALAFRWLNRVRYCFCASMASFAISSIILAVALFFSR
jgi:hypothetical protein